jgi:signal transduction histidine kinase
VHKFLETEFPVPPGEIEATLVSRGEWSGDLRHRRRDGSIITVEAHKVLQTDAEGRPGLVIESLIDVTELRRVDAELKRLNTDLELRIAEEMRKREAAQQRVAQSEKLLALNELAGGLARDFNNVLQAVSGFGSIIGRRAGDAETVERLAGLVEEAARRGTAVTRRLLSFTQRGEFKPGPVSVPTLLDCLRESLGPAIGSGIRIDVDAASDLPPAHVDSGHLESALLNLITNARDAMAGGGVIELLARLQHVSLVDPDAGLAPGSYVCIHVSDTGAGMDADTLRRALEPFFTTKARTEGTGLGLSMVKAFADQSGGCLALSSHPGRGTTATIWLPVAIAAPPTTVVAPPMPAARDVSVHTGVTTPLLLVVDDDELVREVVVDELRERGFRVLEAEGGVRALDILETNQHVSLLISDLAMPGMTGHVLIREAHRRRPGLPAILLTGYAGDDIAPSDHEVIGPYSILHKPITGAELANQVANLLG